MGVSANKGGGGRKSNDGVRTSLAVSDTMDMLQHSMGKSHDMTTNKC